MLKQVTTAASPQQVWERLLRSDPMFILDVRNRDEFEHWRVEGPHLVPTFNIPYFELLDLEGEQEDVTAAVMRGVQAQLMEQLPHDRPILAVCAEGNTSNYVAEGLRRLDFDAVNMEGGMEAWGNYYAWRPVVESERFSLYQMVRPARGCLSHVLVSEHHAAVFDPALAARYEYVVQKGRVKMQHGRLFPFRAAGRLRSRRSAPWEILPAGYSTFSSARARLKVSSWR